ncbi:aldo/keto reductase [Streptomyces sp. NBC_00338]|uniref:aldo/keto reductase n=1 Tax=unclassified Streptomyces TaxID=2593676 RepID=UPI0022521B69|nr:aldo/keto reductase [Streptomyces sp. NBC_00338]MCX5138558.1 aldo/keto reductase [Streptomyces sp. NBC_00338]WSU57209.1 aldo/keto reductase [Streptomyces sp. NBC_01104]
MTSHLITAAAAGTWQLGDLTVNRIGFGAMRLTQNGAAFGDDRGPHDRDRAVAVLRRAVELGVNHIDTAAFYFSPRRSANELINSALGPCTDDLVIATKVGPGRGPSGDWLDWARPGQLRGQVEENLRQLGRDHLDVVNLRVNGPAPIAESFGALAELQKEGFIRHLGLSNVWPEQIAEALAIAPVVCVQNRYGIGTRRADAEEVLRTCGELGIAFVPFYSIAGDAGQSGADRSAEDEALLDVARAHDASPAQVRLAWTLQRAPHVLAIPGTGDPDHLEANVAAGALRLTDEEVRRLAELGRDAG